MEKETIGFALAGIKTEQFATFEENYEAKKKANITTALEFKINKEDRRIGVYAAFTFEQSKKAFLKINVSCHFSIAPDSWDSFLMEDKIVFPKSFISHLTMLTIGTARGILHCKVEGTEFNKFILPTFNVNQMVNEDAEFYLN